MDAAQIYRAYKIWYEVENSLSKGIGNVSCLLVFHRLFDYFDYLTNAT